MADDSQNIIVDRVSPDTVKRVNFLTGSLRGQLRNCVITCSTPGKCFQLQVDAGGRVEVVNRNVCGRDTK